MSLSINDTAIIWPGDSKVKPAGFMIPTHLRVLTIEEVPFVFVRRVDDASECNLDEEPCPHYNTTDSGNTRYTYVSRIYNISLTFHCSESVFIYFLSCYLSVSPIVMNCCRGYCIDLLQHLKQRMNFTASLALSPDGQFGSCLTKNGTGIF